MAPEDERLVRSFYSQPTLTVAESLLGRTFCRKTEEGLVAGRLVEVEAYCGTEDPASHAHRRMTPRNAIMFGPAGYLYVYFTYGMHHCANIVTFEDGVAGAVLLRAVEPLEGLDLMAARRGLGDPRLLARGPARLCQAYGLTRQNNGADLVTGDLWVGEERTLRGPVRTSMRIGVEPDPGKPWRFFEEGPYVSAPPRR